MYHATWLTATSTSVVNKSDTTGLTFDVVFNSLLELERIELHVLHGRSRSDRGATIAKVIRVDEISALGRNHIGVLRVSLGPPVLRYFKPT